MMRGRWLKGASASSMASSTAVRTVEVKRLTDGTWLFGPVEHGD